MTVTRPGRIRPGLLGRASLVAAALIAVGLAAVWSTTDGLQAFNDTLAHLGRGPAAVLIAIVAFTVLACLGAPQVLLIVVLVAAFGPWEGFAYSWIGKMGSCAAGFAVGRRFGARLLQRRAGRRLSLVMEALARRGFWASGIIRIVPSVPSVVVNLAAGCTPMRFTDYMAGTAIGSLPRMALTVFAGQAVITGLQSGGAVNWLVAGLAVAGITILAVLGRHWAKRNGFEQLVAIGPDREAPAHGASADPGRPQSGAG